MLFLLPVDESRYRRLFEDMRKEDFLGRDEYPEMVNGAYELLVHTSIKFGESILKGGRRNFRKGCVYGGRTSVMITQTRGYQGGRKSTSGSN